MSRVPEPIQRIQFAKAVSPQTFENATPAFHIKLLEFIENRSQQVAIAVFRGAGKSTLLTKIYVLTKLYFEMEPYVQIISESERKAKKFLKDIKKTQETEKYKRETGQNPDKKGKTKILGRVHRRMSN